MTTKRGEVQFTAQAWVKIREWDYTLFPLIDNEWRIELSRDGISFDEDYSGNTIGAAAQCSLPLNTWLHVAVAYNKHAGRARFYIYGHLLGEKKLSRPLRANEDLYIGAGPSGRWESANGFIDDLRLWDFEMTEAEVKGLATNPGKITQQGIVAIWNFESSEQGKVLDSSGNGNQGTVSGEAQKVLQRYVN